MNITDEKTIQECTYCESVGCMICFGRAIKRLRSELEICEEDLKVEYNKAEDLQCKVEDLESQLSQEKKRVELLAESIGKIAVELNVIDGSMPATGPQVLMIADDSLELIKNKQSQLSQQQKEHERQLLNAFQYAKHGHRTFSKFPEWAERMKIDVDHNCKPITEDK